jgi:RHS repeat-associated protein
VNTHSKEGWLLRQDVYDSDNQYACSLRWEYDAAGRITLETNALGEKWIRKYDNSGNLVYEQTPFPDMHKEMIYDLANRLTCEKEVYHDGTILSKQFRYNYLGQKVAAIDFYGNETLYIYDEFGRLIQTKHPPIQDAKGTLSMATDSSKYDIFGQVISEANARGHTTTYCKTILGKPHQISHPDGTSESCLYDADGFQIKSVAKNGTYTLYENDYQGRCTKKRVYTPSGELLQTTAATYNAFYKLTETDALGRVTYFTYDGAGRLVRECKNDTEIIIRYDNLGRERERHERYGDNANDIIIQAKKYDLLNRVVNETTRNADGTLIEEKSYEYDEDGNRNLVITYNQAGESVQRTTYDAHKNPIVVTDALDHTMATHISYSYMNAFGQCVPYKETVDPLGNCTVIICDTRGKVAAKLRKNALGQLTQKQEFIYDQAGNRCRWIETVLTPDSMDRKVITEWRYDAMNRIADIIEAAGTPEAKHIHITFNKAGQKENIVKPDGVILRHAYDSLGRLESMTSSDGTIHYNYSYDALDNPIVVKDVVQKRTTFKTYDANNSLSEEILGNGLSIRYSYDHMGRPTCIELPDGSSQEFVYNGARLSEVRRLTNQGAIAYSHRYREYDLSGHVIESELAGNLGTLCMNYDLLGRPVEIRTDARQETVQYDAVGNLIQRNICDSEGSIECLYTYDDLYQLQSETGIGAHEYLNDSLYNRVQKDSAAIAINNLNQVLADEANNYTYDPNGNLILETGSRYLEYAYDAFDRLVSVKTPTIDFRYEYDENNRRLLKTSFTKEGEIVEAIRYIYIGNNEVGRCNEVGTITEYRLLGKIADSERGNAVGVELGGQVFVPIHDIPGNLAALLSSDGSQVAAYRYTVFGEQLIYGLFGTVCPWRFSSKRFDEETELFYFGRRYYSPNLGRWMTCDPEGFDDEPNLYAYVLNSPLTHFDAYGLYALPIPSLNTPTQPHNDRVMANVVQSFFSSPNKTVHSDASFLKSSFAQGEVRVVQVGKRSLSGIGIGFTNGINTSYDHAFESAQNLSRMAKGYTIDLVYNPTNGIASDVVRYFSSSRYYTASPVIPHLHKTWDTFFDHNPPGSIYLQLAHSEGCVSVRNGAMSYDEGRRKQIFVVAIAPGAYIKSEFCKDVVHYASSRDFIPLLDARGKEECANTTTVLEPHANASLLDHDFSSPTYQPHIQEHLDNYINSGGQKLR